MYTFAIKAQYGRLINYNFEQLQKSNHQIDPKYTSRNKLQVHRQGETVKCYNVVVRL